MVISWGNKGVAWKKR